MPEIVLTNVTKRWNKFYAVDNLSLTIDDNAFVTLLGPSGCGKTTCLRMIAGLETPTSGKITIGGVTVFDSATGVNLPPNKRRVGFLFQNYALWPNMTVYQNIAFGLSNVKEEMPQVDFDALRLSMLIRALEKPDELLKAVEECRNRDGNLEKDKVFLKLIDHFEVSMAAAKVLFGYRLHEAPDGPAKARVKAAELSAQLNAIREKHRAAGTELNSRFELVRGGRVETGVRKLTGEEIDLRVRRVSRIVKIGMFMDRYPNELSGGQQQRVAIARTLAPEPTVLFMDEPLSNLDAKLRLEMRSELQRLHLDTGSTFIYVTHDQMEAMTLASKICLIDNGVLQQYDAPLDVYNQPVNLFVADFVGNPAINFIDARGSQQSDGSLELSMLDGVRAVFRPRQPIDLEEWYRQADADIAAIEQARVEKSNKDTPFRYPVSTVNETLEDEPGQLARDEFVVGVRPQFLQLGDSGQVGGEVYSAMPTGMETTVKVRIGNYLLTGVVFGGVLYKLGQAIRLRFDSDNIILFSRKNGRMIALGTMELYQEEPPQTTVDTGE